MEAGVVEYLDKPIEAVKLFAAINRAILARH
jgi:FixJ family two-component response regulator